MALNLSTTDGVPPAGPDKDIIRLKAGETRTVLILSEEIRAVFVHWNDSSGRKGRTEPCQRDQCQGCLRKLPRKWLGYIHVWLMKVKKDAFMELTAGAVEDLTNSLPVKQSLRGTQAVIQRLGADKARLKVDVFPTPKEVDLSVYPAEVLPWATLEKLWNMHRGLDAFQL